MADSTGLIKTLLTVLLTPAGIISIAIFVFSIILLVMLAVKTKNNSKNMPNIKRMVIKALDENVGEPLNACVLGYVIKQGKKTIGRACLVGITDSYIVFSVLGQDFSYRENGFMIFPLDKIHVKSIRSYFFDRNYEIKLDTPKEYVEFVIYKSYKELSEQEFESEKIIQTLKRI